jgi:hypothetical protein
VVKIGCLSKICAAMFCEKINLILFQSGQNTATLTGRSDGRIIYRIDISD